jgi:hypothetical protein
MSIDDIVTMYRQQTRGMIGFGDRDNNYYFCIKEVHDDFKRYILVVIPQEQSPEVFQTESLPNNYGYRIYLNTYFAVEIDQSLNGNYKCFMVLKNGKKEDWVEIPVNNAELLRYEEYQILEYEKQK